MSKRNHHRKQELENLARLERHTHEKGAATRKANHQRAVALGREALDGLFPVRMPSLVEDMDAHEVTSRGGRVATSTREANRDLATDQRPGSPTAYMKHVSSHGAAAPAFIPPRFQPTLVREIETMAYTSPHIVSVRKLGTKGKQHLALALPPDIVEAIGFEHLAGMRFAVELDEGGMMFRAGGARPVAVPTWAVKKVGGR